MKDPEFTQLAPYLKGLPMEEPVAMSTEIHDINKVGCFTVQYSESLVPTNILYVHTFN